MRMNLASLSGLLAAVLFSTFFANVAYSAFTRNALVGNVAELLLLVAAATAFVVSILAHEAAAKLPARAASASNTSHRFPGGNPHD